MAVASASRARRRLKAYGAVAWIFQANPDDWRISAYLGDANGGRVARDTLWDVKPDSYADLIWPGQRVFIWAAKGLRLQGSVAGLIAAGHSAWRS